MILVFTVLQRYDFESNSQQENGTDIWKARCLPYCKGTILKAIHNTPTGTVVLMGVFTVLQRYDFESNSQQRNRRQVLQSGCLPYCKGTILKAIHNCNQCFACIVAGVYRIAKVRF